MDRAAVETYVHARLGEKIRKSYCSMCPFSVSCAARERHEERLREHPEAASAVLMLEYTSQALNERVALYGERSLYQQLAEDIPSNDAVLTRFERNLDRAPFAVYEVRRLYLPGRTKDCRTWHGDRCASPRWWCREKRSAKCRREHRAGFDLPSGWVDTAPWCEGHRKTCRGDQAKGQAWRSVQVVFEGTRQEADLALLRGGRGEGVRIRPGRSSRIQRAHYLDAGEGYPSADAYLVAAPAGVEPKQRAGFEEKWTQVTGLAGTRWAPVRPLVHTPVRRRSTSTVPVRHLNRGQCVPVVGLTA
jgi:hypothetical protein